MLPGLPICAPSLRSMTAMTPSVLLRRLIPEIASLMQQEYTFEQIAAMFYEVGMIPYPESPYGTYEGGSP